MTFVESQLEDDDEASKKSLVFLSYLVSKASFETQGKEA